jgi:CTP:molybdopterin cytidylyltransferase MocA
MNEVGAFRFGGDYLPIRSDQRRSVTAATAWLAAGLDPDWCVVEVRRQTMVVRRIPVTLGFCQRGVVEAWEARHQTEMRLLHPIAAAPPAKTPETVAETALAAPERHAVAAPLVSERDGIPVDWRAILAERGVLVPGREKPGLQKISELGLALTG